DDVNDLVLVDGLVEAGGAERVQVAGDGRRFQRGRLGLQADVVAGDEGAGADFNDRLGVGAAEGGIKDAKSPVQVRGLGRGEGDVAGGERAGGVGHHRGAGAHDDLRGLEQDEAGVGGRVVDGGVVEGIAAGADLLHRDLDAGVEDDAAGVDGQVQEAGAADVA